MRKVTIPKQQQYKGSDMYYRPIQYVYEFSSIQDFSKYLNETPITEAFKVKAERTGSQEAYNFKHLGEGRDEPVSWHGTATYEVAEDLLVHGWKFGASKLTSNLKAVNTVTATVQQRYLDQVGYQAIVPLYLQGVPNNMVNQRRVVQKQKVVDLVQLVCFSSGVSTKEALAEATKSLQVVELLERKGYRANVSVLFSTGVVAARIPLKRANEPLNISKLAYPLCHPAMFRRQYFRFIESCPDIPTSFTMGYGIVLPREAMASVLKPNEIAIGSTLLKLTGKDTIGTRELDAILADLQNG